VPNWWKIVRHPIITWDTLGLISKDPYIFISAYPFDRKQPFGFLYCLALSLINKRVYWLFISTWIIKERSARWVYLHIRRFNRVFFKHKVIFLANTPQENELLKKYGVESIFFNHNALIDENVFFSMGLPKVYRAIYDARVLPYKRHYLANLVEGLALIGFINETEGDPKIKDRLNNGVWLNQMESGEFQFLDSKKINYFLNQSHVGLCLSAEEGAMYASIQYLLAGLPVVTTHNHGGRDEFFESEYVEWVDDNPKAVEAGIQKLIGKSIDPKEIRSKTLLKISEHRYRFINLIQSIWDDHNLDRSFENEWGSLFFNKMQDNSLTWKKIFSRTND